MGSLVVDKLTKHYAGLTAVDEVSFEVAEGEAVGVVGPNGAGKTTLFNCITGFDTPSSGKVTFAGRSVLGFRPHQIVRAGLTRTFQIVKPFPFLPVIDNVTVPLVARGVEDVDDVARDILRRVGLYGSEMLPASNLTEGHLKRLEMARALATNPRMLLLDEPFAGLTSTEIEGLSEVIRSLHEGGTGVVIVEHRLGALLALVDRVLVLDHGSLIADGEPREVMRRREVVEAYLGRSGADDVLFEEGGSDARS